jgi:diguanylate cyclase (GGDEF)-like protein/PAS domain S-box-containing protein
LLIEPQPNGAPPCLRVGAAAGLPEFFLAALDGISVAAGCGGCGTAAFTADRVIVDNVAADPNCRQCHALTGDASIGACWSQPILAAQNEVVGVFSVYLESPQAPSAAGLATIEQLARLASIAIVQRRSAQRLQDSEARFRALAEHTSEAILVHRATRVVYVNPAAVRLFGASSAQDLLGSSTTERIHPDYVAQQQTRMARIMQRQPLLPLVQSRFCRLDGTAFDVDVQGTSIVFDGAEAVHVSIRDVTQRKQDEQQLKVAASVFSHALEGILITTADGTIMDVNEAFTRISGYSRQDVLGCNPRMLGSGRHDQAFYADFWLRLTGQGHWSGEVWNRRKNGEVYAALQHISAVRDEKGQITRYVTLCSDITDRKAQEARLEHMAHFDVLTGLPNRALQTDRLQQAMAQALRRGLHLALVYIDLDGFKAINDTYSHAAGDFLLITLAQRMKQVLRDGDTLARIGGDEFAAVLVDLAHDQDCEPLLQRLLTAASEPVSYGDKSLQVSASLGVTFYPQPHDLTPAQLLNQADQAMYQAKLAGKNRHQVFDPASAAP